MAAPVPADDLLSVALGVPVALALAELATIGLVRRHRGGYSTEFHLMGLLLAVDMGLATIWLYDGFHAVVVATYLAPAGYLVFALSGWVWAFVVEGETGPHRSPAPRWLAVAAVGLGCSIWAAHGWTLVSGAAIAPAGTGWPFVDGFAMTGVTLGGYVLVDREEVPEGSFEHPRWRG